MIYFRQLEERAILISTLLLGIMAHWLYSQHSLGLPLRMKNLVMLMWTFHHMKLMQSTALEQETFDLWKTTPTPACTPFFSFLSKHQRAHKRSSTPCAGRQQIPRCFYFSSHTVDRLWRGTRGSVNRLRLHSLTF